MTERSTHARDAAVHIVQVLRQAGHVAYLAGGCVRDALLGIEPKDYDVATQARPEAVRQLFRRSQYVGEAFGVVLVYAVDEGKSRKAGRPQQRPKPLSLESGKYGGEEKSGGKLSGAGGLPGVEVATFRTEWGYQDGRRPTEVRFTDAQHDAQRRDFTVNGLFADPLDDELSPVEPGHDRVIDYVGGRADLEARVLRAIGDPGERFAEDYLRMLRAARFASRLDFTIDPATADAIRASAKHLGQISRERIGQELMLMLTGPAPAVAGGLIQSLLLDGPVFNEDVQDAPLLTLSSLPVLPTGSGYALSLAAWMLDRGGASGSLTDAAGFAKEHARSIVRAWRAALCLSNGDRDGLAHLLSLLPRLDRWPDLGVVQRKRLLAEPDWSDAMLLAAAVGPKAVVGMIESQSAPLLAEGVSPRAWITGDDLLELGLEPGPRIGALLEGVYDAQLEGEVTSRASAFCWVKGHL